MDDEPILAVDEDFEPEPWDPDDHDTLASNDEWVFERADRLLGSLPQQAGKDRRTEGEVFDHQTLMILHRLLAHGALKSLDFPISTGKEANVFRGTTPGGGLVAVKIYRTNTSTFKHVLKYIQGDDRFQGLAKDKRGLVAAWCQKEFRNLARMRDAGCNVPEPIQNLGNVLVTEFLGTPEGAWPTLKEVGRLDDPERHLDELIGDYRLAYTKAKLVHADFSEYNILVEHCDKDPDDWTCRQIDVGQAVLNNHPMAHEYIVRDANNVARFFTRQGVRVTGEDVLARMEGA